MKNFILIINIGMVLLVATLISEKEAPDRSQTNKRVTKAGMEVPATLVDLKNNDMLASGADFRSAFSSKRNGRGEEAYIKDFIYQISEARIMDMEEGKLASQRGTSRALKDYGTLMISDQTRMLKDLSGIAHSKKMDVASSLGESKTEGLSDLNKLHGKQFDSKFIKMMIIDHRRDVRKLEKALISKDPEIQVFATKYLPIVKSHLDKIEAIKETK